MQQFGDVDGSQAWGSYCKQGLCHRILNVIYFKIICSFTFAHLKILWCNTDGDMSWVVWHIWVWMPGIRGWHSGLLSRAHLFILDPGVFSEQPRGGVCLAVPMLLEGTVILSVILPLFNSCKVYIFVLFSTSELSGCLHWSQLMLLTASC